MTTPPLHGTDPHGQGTVAVVDVTPDNKRPFSGDTTGRADGEDIVVGRSRGTQRADGTYNGHITIAALFGNEIVGVDTVAGQKRSGPLDAVQQNLLNPLCNGTAMQICLSAVTADSETTATGSTNRFSTARATLGGAAGGVDVMAAESTGNISSDGTCQTATGTSQVENATLAGTVVASAARSSTTSRACNDGTAPQQTNTSSVIGLGGVGVPLPAPGCADGTADTVTGVPTLLPIVCNADDSGDGAQATGPYGVRDALDVFLLAVGTTLATKISTAASDSRAVAPPRATPPPPARPECSDGVDNDGDGLVDFPADKGCTSASDTSEAGGGGTPTRPECSDGSDNDGDGLIDFPADKGCTSASDDSETGGGGGGARPECSDGRDNDGDGRVDFPADSGCTSRSDDSEAGGGGNGGGGGNNGGGGGGGGGGTPACRDRVDNDGDGKVDLADPQCEGDPNGTSEGGTGGSLPFTGADLGLVLLLGGGALGSGLLLLRVSRRRTATPGPRILGT